MPSLSVGFAKVGPFRAFAARGEDEKVHLPTEPCFEQLKLTYRALRSMARLHVEAQRHAERREEHQGILPGLHQTLLYAADDQREDAVAPALPRQEVEVKQGARGCGDGGKTWRRHGRAVTSHRGTPGGVMEAAKLVSAPSQAGSELNTSVGGTSQHSLERRVAWLEEDVAVIHRRVKVECADTGGIAGDPGLRALVARLDGELAQERRARELLEVRMSSLEEALKREHSEREANMKSFSQDLESTMRGRIDDGLSSGAASMRDRTDQTEVRLRSLIKRVDEGLTAGAAALQDSLSQSANGAEKLPERSVGRDRSAAPRGSVSPVTQQQQQQQHTQLQHQQQPQLQHQQHHQHQQHSQHQAGGVWHEPATLAANESGAFTCAIPAAHALRCIPLLLAGARHRAQCTGFGLSSAGAEYPWDGHPHAEPRARPGEHLHIAGPESVSTRLVA
ncbi:unnamed protein product [Effrenium voratum]|nr:unnamed protein product [Effrenium voratum]